MFKLIKWSFYSVVGIIVVAMFLSEPHEDSVFSKSETETKIEEPVKVVKKELTAFEKEELELKKKQSAIRSIANQLTGVCMQKIRASAKYPNKVDFHAFTTSQSKTWNNFNGGEHEFPHRYHYRVNGEMNNQTIIKKTETGDDENLVVTNSSEDTIINNIEDTVAEGYLVTKSEIFMTKNKSYRAYVLIEVKKSVFDI